MKMRHQNHGIVEVPGGEASRRKGPNGTTIIIKNGVKIEASDVYLKPLKPGDEGTDSTKSGAAGGA